MQFDSFFIIICVTGAPGWQRFLGRSSGLRSSVSVNLTQEEADLIRCRRRQGAAGPRTAVLADPTAQTDGDKQRAGGALSSKVIQDTSETAVFSGRKLSNDQEVLPVYYQHGVGPHLAAVRLQVAPAAPAEPLAHHSHPALPSLPLHPVLHPSPRDDFFEVPPPLPPKPKQKISVIGSPNSDQFIVIDNSAFFSPGGVLPEAGNPGEDLSSLASPPSFSSMAFVPFVADPEAGSSASSLVQERLTEPAGLVTNALHLRGTPDLHSRSDSGLSSMSSWTTAGGSSCSGARSGCSSVRSSSIVSNSSTKLEELLEEQQRRSTAATAVAGGSSCSLRLVEELAEQQEELQDQLPCSAVNKLYFQAPRGWNRSNSLNSCRPDELQIAAARATSPQPQDGSETDYDDAEAGTSTTTTSTTTAVQPQQQTSKASGVQRQLSTIRQQKERLIRDIVENERLGQDLTAVAAERLSARELGRLTVFLVELEKVVLLLLSLGSRLQRAEAELLGCGNLTDWDKESIR